MHQAWFQSAYGVVAIDMYPEPIRFIRDPVTLSIAPSQMGSSREPVRGSVRLGWSVRQGAVAGLCRSRELWPMTWRLFPSTGQEAGLLS